MRTHPQTRTHRSQDTHMLTPLSLPLRRVHCHSNGSLETTGGGTHRTQGSMSHSKGFVCLCLYIIHNALPILLFARWPPWHSPGILLYDPESRTLKTPETKTENWEAKKALIIYGLSACSNPWKIETQQNLKGDCAGNFSSVLLFFTTVTLAYVFTCTY